MTILRPEDTNEARAVRQIIDSMNCFSFEDKEFCDLMSREHRTLQQSFTRLCLAWIKHCSEYQDFQIDGRNELAVDACKRIAEVMNEENIGGLPMI